jgi:predicted ATPase
MLGVEDPERRADPPADPDARKATALAALIEMMDLFRGEGSALFVLEDAHWSDPTTLELLDRAAGLAAQRPWLILVTARPDGALAWSGGGAVSEMRLEPLVAAEAMRLCACLDPERRLPPEAAREIVERSDGIPLFVEEVTRSALEALLDGISPAAIPMSLHDALIARLDRLGPAYEVARLAAVIGRRFERSLLAAIAGLDAKDLDRALGILTAAGLVESGAVGAYRFRHVLIRDAAYESLLKSDRQAIHGKVARAILERFPAMRETEPDRIARHLALGGEISEAVQFWTMASEFARASGAWREAGPARRGRQGAPAATA